jgi:hypothetical protein
VDVVAGTVVVTGVSVVLVVPALSRPEHAKTSRSRKRRPDRVDFCRASGT